MTGKGEVSIKRRVRQLMEKEDAQLLSRYRDLYGDGGYEEELEDHRRKRRTRILVLLAGFFVVFGIVVYKDMTGIPGAVYEGDQLIAVKRPAAGEGAVSFDAKVFALTEHGTVTDSRSFYISAYDSEPQADRALAEESYEDAVRRRIDLAARQAGSDRTEQFVYLPQSLEDGTRLVWAGNRQPVLPLLIALGAAVFYYLYRSRFAAVSKKEQEARESVIRELPEFLHKLILLLGAGVVLETAFRRAMEDVHGDSYFAGQIQYIRRRADLTNASLQKEFRDFAQRSGVRELMRVAGILEDNVERGTDLTVKLKEETELLWFERKKQSEEKGRLAETKLTMPLAILLCVLVLVTVSPALFEM